MKKLPALLVLLLAFFIGTTVYAATPTLSVSGSGDVAQLRITATPRTDVWLKYGDTSGASRSQWIGTTDSEGYFSSTLNASEIGVALGSQVYVMLGSTTSGARSAAVSWPTPTSAQISLPFDKLTIGLSQSTVVPVFTSDSNSVYVKSLNGSSVSAVTNGGIMTVTGQSIGQTVVTVCRSGSTSNCKDLTVTVQSGGNTTTGQSFQFSPASPVVTVGQSTTVTISGLVSNSFYISANSNPSIAQVNITNNAITISGNTVGSAVATVCQSVGVCASLPISVIAKNNVSDNSPTASQNSLTVSVGRTGTVLVAGVGNYVVESNNKNIATVELVNGTNLVVTGVVPGTATVSACDSGGKCAYVSVVVTEAPVVSAVTPSTASSTNTPVTYTFSTFLGVGSTGTAVTQLQKKLTALGIYKGPITSYYGSLTQAAVKKFQAAHTIKQAGYVGPSTRAALNAN